MTPKVDNLVVTPQYAQHLIDNSLPDWQRPLSQDKVNQYAADMTAGIWHDWTTIEMALVEGKELLINGQHRLRAVIASGVQARFVFVTHCLSEHDVKEYYGVIDTQKIRSLKDAIHARDNSDFSGLTNRQIRIIGEAVSIILADFSERKVMSHAARISNSRVYVEQFQALDGIGAGTDLYNRFLTAPYVASAVYLLKHQPELARVFIQNVFSGDAEKPNDPTRKLREFILVGRQETRQSSGGSGRMLRLRYFSRCWNAAYEGQLIQKVYLPQKVFFLGTPLTEK